MPSPVVFITGGAKGIGKGIAARLLAEGWRVALVDEDREAGRQAIEELGNESVFFQTDVSSEKQVKRAIEGTGKKFKRLDALINNAGVASPHLPHLDVKTWNRVLSINLTGAFLCAKYALPALAKTHGSIVNIASTRALMSEPHTEAYAATKGGLVALTHALAISYGPNVRVNCVSPGWIDTSAWQKMPSKPATLRPIDHSQHPVGRVGQPGDVSALVSYLISSDAGFVTGQNFTIDGGMTRKMIYAE